MSDCLCKSANVTIFSCSGAANVGQISNTVAVELTREGKGNMYCLAGLGGHIPGIIDGTKKAEKIVVIDGCAVSCAKKIVEHTGFNVDEYILITEHGINKTPGNSEYTKDQIDKIKKIVEEKI